MDQLIADKAIAALSPIHVAGYLKSHGWEERGRYGEYGQLFVLKEKEVVLPRLPTIGDFGRRMREVLRLLSEAEGRDPNLILFDLTLAPFDVVRVRTFDADEYGSVLFEEGLHLHEQAKRLMVSAAHAAASSQPRKAWKGRRPEIVGKYLERIRLGQTENASFSLTILSPYSFNPSPASLFDEDAFGRRVTKRFATALSAVEESLADSVGNPISAFEKRVGNGVSAELCGALAALADNDRGIQVSVGWSPAKPISDRVQLRLTREDAAVLYEVARTFARAEPELDYSIDGLVEEIKEKPENFSGSVVVQTVLPGDSRARKIRIQFDEGVRNLVYDAAKEKRWVRVTGNLVREGNLLKLLNPRDFMIVELVEGAQGLDD